jgi:hypothetical protein
VRPDPTLKGGGHFLSRHEAAPTVTLRESHRGIRVENTPSFPSSVLICADQWLNGLVPSQPVAGRPAGLPDERGGRRRLIPRCSAPTRCVEPHRSGIPGPAAGRGVEDPTPGACAAARLMRPSRCRMTGARRQVHREKGSPRPPGAGVLNHAVRFTGKKVARDLRARVFEPALGEVGLPAVRRGKIEKMTA